MKASRLMVSTGGPFKRNACDRSPDSPPTACTASLRVNVSGLYCSAIIRCVTPLSGSSRIRPAFSNCGEFGNVLINLLRGLRCHVANQTFEIDVLGIDEFDVAERRRFEFLI